MAQEFPQRSMAIEPGTTRFTLIRHGQSQAGRPGHRFPLVDGHGDPPLTDLGHQQAHAVGERLRTESFHALYASSLTRTQETAAPLAGHLDLEVRVDRELREVFLGDWEGGLFREIAHEGTHPAIQEFRQTGEWGAIPNAESNADLIARVGAAVARLHQAHVDEHVALFVHGGVIAALLSKASGGPMQRLAGAENGSIHRLWVNGDRWTMRAFNDSTHLADVMTP